MSDTPPQSDPTPWDDTGAGAASGQPIGGTPSAAGTPAELGQRIGARLIDHIIVGVVTAVVIVPLAIGAAVAGQTGGTITTQILGAALIFGYFVLLEHLRGQTLGKMILNLRVVGPDGQNPDLMTAAKRNAWTLIGLVPLIGWLGSIAAVIFIIVTINQSPERRGWHDQFAGAQVVRTR